MNGIVSHLMVAVFTLLTISCYSDETQEQSTLSYMDININIGGKTLPIHLIDNVTTRKLAEALKQSPVTYYADDYGGFEKVGSLGLSLPTDNSQITTEKGDVILYGSNQIVLFYGSNSWNYTRLGRIEYQSFEELKDFLKAGQGRIRVTLSVANTCGISQSLDDSTSKRRTP